MVAGLGGVESAKLEMFNRVPLSRLGQPEDAPSVRAFLLSDGAKYSKSSPDPKSRLERLREYEKCISDSHTPGTFFKTSVPV